jgi:aminoglycoside 2''-phosphotransferase
MAGGKWNQNFSGNRKPGIGMDHILDQEVTYSKIITGAYPRLEIHSARLHTSDGQFNDVLFVNDDLIFRFPRYEKSLGGFLQEIQLLQKLQGHLSLSIPDPIYVNVETRSVGETFMGYKLLPGKPLFREILIEITDEITLEVMAQQLADFLRGLHTLSPAVLGLDLPLPDKLAEFKTFFSNIKEHLFPLMRSEARHAATEHFENYLSNSSMHEFKPAMIHGDFGGSNILFHQSKITGIIDFSFAGPGDPAQDIAAVSTYGEPFFARICRHYPNIDSLLERTEFYRGTFALQEALHGFLSGDKEAFASGMEEYL